MTIDFSIDPEFQEQLDWMDSFVTTEIEPIDLYFRGEANPFDRTNETANALIRPLQKKVQDRGLWACHIGPHLGGLGYGQVKLALMNEILGRALWAQVVFGCQAPDSGNAEILAHYGTGEQRERYLRPLLAERRISSTYSMTEPQGGSDPNYFTCQAVRDGDEWVITGEKWFASNFHYSTFLIVMVITNPDVPVYRGSSMILVPSDAEGLEVVTDVGLGAEPLGEGDHRPPAVQRRASAGREPAGRPRARGSRSPRDAWAGAGSITPCGLWGTAQRALDMMCERVLSRETKGSLIGEKQSIQHWIADSWIQIQQFRLQVLHCAWLIDTEGDYAKIRQHIAGVKVATPKVLIDVVYRAMHAHGSLGVSNLMPLTSMWMSGPVMGIADGPTEVHKDTIAKQILKSYKASDGLFPSQHLPSRIATARSYIESRLEHEIANL